jgi:transposase IS481 family protein
MVRRIEQLGWTPIHAADAAGVSRATAYKWLGRFRGDDWRIVHPDRCDILHTTHEQRAPAGSRDCYHVNSLGRISSCLVGLEEPSQ